MALVEDGDTIRIDAEAGTIDLAVDEGRAGGAPRPLAAARQRLWLGRLVAVRAAERRPRRAGAVTHPGAKAERHVYADI
ncbi:hypothetical protein AB5I41_04855 [Sphingomonas sp. MMS24-JH45]